MKLYSASCEIVTYLPSQYFMGFQFFIESFTDACKAKHLNVKMRNAEWIAEKALFFFVLFTRGDFVKDQTETIVAKLKCCRCLSLFWLGRAGIANIPLRERSIWPKHSDDWRAYNGGLICVPWRMQHARTPSGGKHLYSVTTHLMNASITAAQVSNNTKHLEKHTEKGTKNIMLCYPIFNISFSHGNRKHNCAGCFSLNRVFTGRNTLKTCDFSI